MRSVRRQLQNMRLLSFTYTALLSFLIGSVDAKSQEIPDFVKQLIEQYESGLEVNSPGSIWQYNYKGAIVFYTPPFLCCDIPSKLFDVEGDFICAPDGGIAGVGDGKCIDFVKQRTEGRVIWVDKRLGASK